MTFEWDENKNLANIKKHGISFNHALHVFDNNIIDDYDGQHSDDEDRYNAIGHVDSLFITLTYTIRLSNNGGENVRIISARKSDEDEIEKFFRRFRNEGSL